MLIKMVIISLKNNDWQLKQIFILFNSTSNNLKMKDNLF